MSNIKINEKILEGLRIVCEGDEIIEKFLKDLIYEEAEHYGQWRWRESYKNKVDIYSSKWEESNEN